MKISEITDYNPDEPIVLPIMRNAIKKGLEVRVYYKGDGGIVKDIEWDPPAKARAQAYRGNGPETREGNGASSFKTVDGRWVVIGDHNLEKLKMHKRTDRDGKVSLTLKADVGRARTDEGMNDGRNWVDTLSNDFMKIIHGAGWMLNKGPTYGLEHGYFGGTMRASASAKRSMLTLEEQRKLLMKMIAKKLIEVAKMTSVTVAPYNVKRNAGALQIRPHTTIADMIDSWEDGMYVKMDGTAFDMYWSIRIPKDIVDHVSDEFAKVIQKATSNEDE
jgi:hypothetical protein